MSKIETLLAEWKSKVRGKTSEEDLSLQILDTAESIVAEGTINNLDRKFFLEFLDTTKKPEFLKALGNPTARERWVEVVFSVIQSINYNVRDMLQAGVEKHPGRILFREISSSRPIDWTYEQISRHIREIATVFYQSSTTPRVALYTDNCLEGACADLACLCYDIFNTPLNTHFNSDILLSIFDSLGINIVVTDTKERMANLLMLQQKSSTVFRIFSLQRAPATNGETTYLQEECKKLTNQDIDSVLSGRKVLKNNQVTTTMFTSGSTGLPKGVSFSVYNLVSKRFARAAALPEVGDETFLCYLPLFHTFGRYLEMMGVIFWDGTYVFAGNNSAETLFSQFPLVNPTGFISIPLRWQELYELCLEKINGIESEDLRIKTVREVTGQKLHWGLSAAGWLDPDVFRFFNQYGIRLCSGFGMTEATGGITMTPPGQYRDSSVGIPLPGVRTRLTGDSELEISGHYIGRYLEEAGPGDSIPYPVSVAEDAWLSTGDVFKLSRDDHFEIIDRLKDIYKNNRGQTIAPQIIEKKFSHVPGIKSTFVVGDNRPYNVLLITPDTEDAIWQSIRGDNLREYFHQIVTSANADVAPYERVVNFTLLDRDFSQEMNELTPKGSFNRKTIENNFREVISGLYTSNTISIAANDFTILIPRWFFRDMGILETDILYSENKLYNRVSDQYLTFKKINGAFYQIGDFKYKIRSETVDIGIFARQPKLWIGNPELIAFCPVKEGWDRTLDTISENILVATHKKYREEDFPGLKSIKDQTLVKANTLVFRSLFLGITESYSATDELGQLFADAEPRLVNVLHHRLEALAYHSSEEIRALAYRILLLKSTEPDLIPYMPVFIDSGRSFLNEKSIREIASGNFGKHRLDALKQRLYWYRTHLKWPAARKNREQFEYVLRMLYDFAALHLEFYVSIRAELSRWILHKADPYLSAKAEELFYRLAAVFEKEMALKIPLYPLSVWKSRLVFEYGMTGIEKDRITYIFQSTTFLQESIVLAFNEPGIDLMEVPEGGIWVLRLQSYKEFKHYRLSINTIYGKHFDLHMVLSENPDFKPKSNTFYWLASLAGFPFGPAVAPFLGSSRPDIGILSTQYIGGLTAWDKIREFAEIHTSSGYLEANAWKKVFIKAFTVFFRAWHHSGYQIVPGVVTPANVVVPQMEFRESAVILSLTGWTEYKSPVSLVGPMLRDFYCRTANIYPWCKKQLRVNWIFDACIEALGQEEAFIFFENLRKDLGKSPLYCFEDNNILDDLEKYLNENLHKQYLPLALFNAIDQYREWHKMNPLTTAVAKEQTLHELIELYKLQGYPELIRYYFYRHSYFSDATVEIIATFDKLLEKMQSDENLLPIQLLELSELQSAIIRPEDKNVFSRMVFPRLQSEQEIGFLKVGENQAEHVVVRFDLKDKTGSRYIFREPVEPREIGQLYQLFFREQYPKEISKADHHFVVEDENGKLIGGLTWRYLDDNNVFLDGIVVTSSLQGKGIASAMIADFLANMAARGIKVIKAHFLFGNYYLKHSFEVDEKWGALIRILDK
jgi:long-chain acyl-CoA synthetase